MPEWELTVKNFRFASDKISIAQDAKIRDYAALILFGRDPIPSISEISEVVVIGCGKGTNPEPHAVRRGVAVRSRLIDHLEDFGAMEEDSNKIAWGGTETEVMSNKQVTGEDRKVRILIEWKEPEKPKIRPLTRRQIKFLVWAVTGERPTRLLGGKLLKEFLDFTGVQNFLKKPSNAAAAKLWAKTYAKVLKDEFSAEPEKTLGAMIGSSYSLLDVATGRPTRRRPAAKTKGQKKFSEGFSWGYGEMRAHLARFPFRGKGGDESKRDKALTNLLQRLNQVAGKKTVTGNSFAIASIYNAFHQATEPNLRTMKDQQYFASKSRGWFCYPSFCVKHTKWR